MRLDLTNIFKQIYSKDLSALKRQELRYNALTKTFHTHFQEKDLHYFSTPGRVEIGGNHTDHNNGRVLAASVDLDAIAAAVPSENQKVILNSKGYGKPFVLDLTQLNPRKEEEGTTTALIRGIASRFKELGYKIGGFHACIESDVLPGSGLSSSGTIEVLIGTIFNTLFNNGQIKPEIVAMVGQYSENSFYGKPCGLMDQLTCAVGGIVTIDFEDPGSPKVKKINKDFKESEYSIMVVNTGGNHIDLTEDYAAIPKEMRDVARALGHSVCRECDFEEFISRMDQLAEVVGDRAVLRAYHFFNENKRVLKQVEALESGQFDEFLKLVQKSGDSSFKWLQNIFSPKMNREQGLTKALARTHQFIEDVGHGACRVHGGGFAGTILTLIPNLEVSHYIKTMDPIFGKGSTIELKIRPLGTLYLNRYCSV